MKLIKKIERVKGFYLLKGEEVIVTEDKIQIGDKYIDSNPNDDVFCDNDVLTKRENFKKQFVYKDGEWHDEHPKYSRFIYFGEDLYYSTEDDEDAHVQKYSIFDNGKETLFEIKTDSGMFTPKYDKKHDLYLFLEINCQNLFFYTRDLKFLWKYQTEAPDIDIKFNEITIAGDVITILTSKYIEEVNDYTHSFGGYNILTGQKLWFIKDFSLNTHFHAGNDNMLYSTRRYYEQLFIEKLNPNDGSITEYEIKCNYPVYDTHIYPTTTTLYGNKLYFSVERRKGLCGIGVVNLDTMAIEEEAELDTYDEGVCLSEAPIVTEDRVYVFIPLLEELHIFER